MFLRLEDIARSRPASIQLLERAMSDNEHAIALEEDYLVEIANWAARAARWGRGVKSAVKKVTSRIAKTFKGKKPPTPPKPRPVPKPKPDVKPREKAYVRPRGPSGGIKKKAKPLTVQDILARPRAPVPSAPSLRPKPPPMAPKPPPPSARPKGPKPPPMRPSFFELPPDDMDTTAPGPAIPAPKKFKKRPGPSVNMSNMYKHVVRAIYNTGTQSGYNFHSSPAKSSQVIARSKMIDWGYAKKRTDKGGIEDKRMIQLTPKGISRDWKRHSKEPSAVKRAKDRDYMAIYNMDPA